MSAEVLAVNTGPLILLDKANALDIVGKLPFQFVCPPAVRGELDVGMAQGYASIRPAWLTVCPLQTPLSSLARSTLDLGEAEVIELAIQRGFGQVCLDDLRGRRLATASGLRVVGALGLLVLAKRTGVIPLVKPFTERLKSAGAWYSTDLVDRVLQGVGE